MRSIVVSVGLLLSLSLLLAAPEANAQNSTSRGATESIDLSESSEQSEAQAQGKRNIPVLVSGIVASGLGGFGLLIGGVTLALSGASGTAVCNNGDCHPATKSDRSDMRTIGWVGLVSGVTLVAVGIPLIVVGAKRRPEEPSEQTAALRVVTTPGGGALHMTF